jgi:transcription-repair coupling factor (superfamily II helicase)
LEHTPDTGRVTLVAGSLRQGWSLHLRDSHTSLLTDGEVFGSVKERRPRRRTVVPQAPFTSELTPGSYVVHVDHGVARFSGTVKMGEEDGQREYLVLEYAEGDRLYVPTEHLDRVSPYVAVSDSPPTLTRLGTAEWARAKERAKGAAREMAQELLSLYAARAMVQGHVYDSDSPWQAELEESFPYEETSDQRRTIVEVKRDMETSTPMDRLVCGDVGYGKTEVALRASFKAVTDGFQVAFLVPTTVLAQQHYVTFSERLRPFPVRVEVLSRFRTDREQQEVVEGLISGRVDIVIGTHRLIQKDVAFKNLGLVIVDEEQRFGVSHKEKLKSMRQEVDVLTLSATPIPRTLYMSLSGLRDMSTMETPPEERLPVRTYVGEYSEEMAREAILRELERGGQVFFLHNRVHTIHRVAGEVQRLVPQASLSVAHGRMPEEELEQVMADFSRGEIDVLVCTTIIESGLDIPNANTLIIDRADMLGLSQLYQLRGRVGRGTYRAHAYLFTPRHRRITEAARKRLHAILEASELGAGFRIAMRDLEIRGAGNLLGAEQSGHIHAVGFDLYSQLLQQAISEVKAGETGKPSEERPRIETRVELGLPAFIPDSYVEHLPTRLAIYQRLAKVQKRDEVEEMGGELRDRFGPLPQPVSDLLYVVELKALAQEAEVESVVRSQGQVVLGLVTPIGGARLALQKELGSHAQVGYQQVRLSLRSMDKDWKDGLLRSLEQIIAFRERVKDLVVTSQSGGQV